MNGRAAKSDKGLKIMGRHETTRLELATDQQIFNPRIGQIGEVDRASATCSAISICLRVDSGQLWSGTEPPNFVIQELKGARAALLDVFAGLPELRNGYVYANDKPGLGVDINETEAKKYPCENPITTWTQTRLVDGTLQTP